MAGTLSAPACAGSSLPLRAPALPLCIGADLSRTKHSQHQSPYPAHSWTAGQQYSYPPFPFHCGRQFDDPSLGGGRSQPLRRHLGCPRRVPTALDRMVYEPCSSKKSGSRGFLISVPTPPAHSGIFPYSLLPGLGGRNLRRVVITGMGAVSPNGVGREAFAEATLAGTSGVRRISHFDPSEITVQIAGEVPNFDELAWVEKRERK